ncbi:MAG: hypothetical protein LBN38_08665 [Verrucomicrobiota bacterium]|jgi:hypothetical protein|nr:hypothetical protein [Verrucomicrobiota bacterium]
MQKIKWTLLLLAILLSGVCAGFYANTLVMRTRIRHFSRVPANLPEHITHKLTRTLHLNPTQQEKVRQTIMKHHLLIEEAWAEKHATFQQLMRNMRNEISVLLTPEQQAAYQNHLDKLDQERENRQHLRQGAFPPPPP